MKKKITENLSQQKVYEITITYGKNNFFYILFDPVEVTL